MINYYTLIEKILLGPLKRTPLSFLFRRKDSDSFARDKRPEKDRRRFGLRMRREVSRKTRRCFQFTHGLASSFRVATMPRLEDSVSALENESIEGVTGGVA